MSNACQEMNNKIEETKKKKSIRVISVVVGVESNLDGLFTQLLHTHTHTHTENVCNDQKSNKKSRANCKWRKNSSPPQTIPRRWSRTDLCVFRLIWKKQSWNCELMEISFTNLDYWNEGRDAPGMVESGLSFWLHVVIRERNHLGRKRDTHVSDWMFGKQNKYAQTQLDVRDQLILLWIERAGERSDEELRNKTLKKKPNRFNRLIDNRIVWKDAQLMSEGDFSATDGKIAWQPFHWWSESVVWLTDQLKTLWHWKTFDDRLCGWAERKWCQLCFEKQTKSRWVNLQW